MSKHTSGPWRIYGRGFCPGQSGPIIVNDRTDENVAWAAKDKDARLLVQAPEMYKALQCFASAVEAGEVISAGIVDTAVALGNMARAILREIEGGQIQ